jgi:hypothetical protein
LSLLVGLASNNQGLVTDPEIIEHPAEFGEKNCQVRAFV